MQLWPAIDILNGQCVRLKQGDYAQQTVYSTSPAEMALHWAQQGTKHLHLVDLDGAKDKEPVNMEAVRSIVQALSGTNIEIELGGGIRSEETIAQYLDIGVHRLVIGTLALKEPDWFCEMAEKYPGKLVLGIDAKNGKVATEGWLETSQTSAVELAQRYIKLPLAALVYTDIAKDGMLEGPNFKEMTAMKESVPFPVVASGGVSSLDDIRQLKETGLPACIIGKALYEGSLSLKEALELCTKTI